MNSVSEQKIAEFIKHYQIIDAPEEEEPHEEADGPFMYSKAEDLAKQLGDYLRILHKEDLDSHIANNTWLQQIDKTTKAFDVKLTLLALLIIIMPLIARSCGG